MKFENDFLLGAATAAHQVEGNNTHSDCWVMEHMKNTSFLEQSLDAVDHYHRYEEDIRLMAAAGLNAYRFSLEWARIEPAEGAFCQEEITHYRNMIHCCRRYGIEPIVTLHHFSSPAWLIGKGGWEAESTVGDFARYTRYVMEQLGSDLSYVCTINEANMGLQIAAIAERFKRQMMAQMLQKQGGSADKEDAGSTVQVGINLQKMMANQQAAAQESKEIFGVETIHNFTSMRSREGDTIVIKCHEAARAVIRELAPHIKVGLTLSLHDMQVREPGGEIFAEKEWEDEFLHYLPSIKEDDFLGVQNYTRSLFGAEGGMAYPAGTELTQMDYEFYPEALEHVIRRVAAEYKGILLISENGIATADDSRRIAFIEKALSGVQNCIQDGIPVRGYLHWSLLDNFEWQKGYSMTFGLISVDRTTQVRAPKQSLSYLGSWR